MPKAKNSSREPLKEQGLPDGPTNYLSWENLEGILQRVFVVLPDEEVDFFVVGEGGLQVCTKKKKAG